jgi:hypothetical protein
MSNFGSQPTHSDCCSPPWVVDASIGASPFQRINSIITRRLAVLILNGQLVFFGAVLKGG